MPNYEYACDQCGNRFEKFQKFSDDPIRECPNCHGPVRRVIHASGIIFKGSGWYITDHGRAGVVPGSSKNGKGEKPEAKESGKDSSKSETPASTTPKVDKGD